MSDIPKHLIEAWKSAPASMLPTIAALLAALRPEDAHLVPAWRERQKALILTGFTLMKERDEARAEVERLKACNCDPLDDGRWTHHPTCPKAQ